VFLIEWPDKGGAETPALDLSLQLTRGEAERRTLDWVSFSPAGQALMERLVG
jgi:tRNA A37 threonylcarbamoyladenosine biosynthesis protein TsaE